MHLHQTRTLRWVALAVAITVAAFAWLGAPASPASAFPASSCQGTDACTGTTGTIGQNSCNGDHACENAVLSIGDGSCVGVHACFMAGVTVTGNDSCVGDYACDNAGLGTSGGVTMGHDSCIGHTVCQYLGAYASGAQSVGDNSCTGTATPQPSEPACDLAGALGSGLSIGNNACNGDGTCYKEGYGTSSTVDDCTHNTVTPQACLVATTVEVRKFLFPSYDSGKFDLSVAGNVEATAVGHNGTTGPVEVTPGSVTVAEAGANGTNLHNYRTTVVCVSDGSFVGYGYSTSLSINVYSEQAVVCTFINQKIVSLRWWWWR
jgi:hypothetical protein